MMTNEQMKDYINEHWPITGDPATVIKTIERERGKKSAHIMITTRFNSYFHMVYQWLIENDIEVKRLTKNGFILSGYEKTTRVSLLLQKQTATSSTGNTYYTVLMYITGHKPISFSIWTELLDFELLMMDYLDERL